MTTATLPVRYLIFEAYSTYLEHLENGGERFVLPPVRRNGSEYADWINASEIGMCPLLAAKRRAKVPMTNPPTKGQLLSRRHLMQQGVRDAEPFQEALCFNGANQSYHAEPEYNVYWHSRQVKGRIDCLLVNDNGYHIIEFKRRDAPNGKDPQPKESDVLQVLAYAEALQEEGKTAASINIVTINRYGFKVWDIDLWDGCVCCSDGDMDNNVWFFEEEKGYQALDKKIANHKRYILGELTIPPFSDPLNNPDAGSWYCFQWDSDKAKAYKSEYKGMIERTGFIKPRCEHYCHGEVRDRIEVRETGYGTGQYEFVEE